MSSCGVGGCPRAPRYQFTSDTRAAALRCLRHALVYPPVARRAMQVALVVGTILFAINQADVVLNGQFMPLIVAKIGLTYLVPYSVSTYSTLAASHFVEN